MKNTFLTQPGPGRMPASSAWAPGLPGPLLGSSGLSPAGSLSMARGGAVDHRRRLFRVSISSEVT
jgi:hypothetical protein